MREKEKEKANEERIIAFNLKQEQKFNAVKDEDEFEYEELKERKSIIKSLKESGVRKNL